MRPLPTKPSISRSWLRALSGATLLLAASSAGADEAAPADTDGAAAAPATAASAPAIQAPKAPENRLLDITLAGSRLIAVGQQGVILTSEDGNTWQQAKSPVSVMLNRVIFTDAQNGWALGYDATLLQSTDAGMTWNLRHRDAAGRALYDLKFLDAQHGLAIGAYGTMLETRDGGANWSARDDVVTQLGMHLNAIVSLGNGTLFIAGERGLMLRSSDAGTTWTPLDSPYAGSLFGAIPHGTAGAIVHGMRGNVYVTDDVGACPALDPASWDSFARETVSDPAPLGWRRLETPIRESLFGSIALDGGASLLVGVNGAALKLDASASALETVQTPAKETLSHGLVHHGRVIAVGRRGVQDLGASP